MTFVAFSPPLAIRGAPSTHRRSSWRRLPAFVGQELCGLRFGRDVDFDRKRFSVSRGVAFLPGVAMDEIETKNRRSRTIAIDDVTLAMLKA